MTAAVLFTVGHGTLGIDAFLALLTGAGVDRLVDVRRFPGSRRHPHFGRERLHGGSTQAGIDYRWEERLGGRRSVDPDSPNTAIRNRSFRGYVDWMASQEWRSAMDEVVAATHDATVAVMCSEAVWWRCHRRFIADAALLVHHLTVEHLMHDGRRTPHPPTDGARVVGAGIVYDAGATRLEP